MIRRSIFNEGYKGQNDFSPNAIGGADLRITPPMTEHGRSAVTKLMQFVFVVNIFIIYSCVGDDDNTSNSRGASPTDDGTTTKDRGTTKDTTSVSSTCDFEACGGDIVGEWEIVDICLDDFETITNAAIDEPACSDFLQGYDFDVAGSFVFDLDGSGEGDCSMVINAEFLVTDKCMQALNGVDMTSSNCETLENRYKNVADSSAASCSYSSIGCRCDVSSYSISVSGGGAYKVKDDRVIDDAGYTLPFCVRGDQLQLYFDEDDVAGVMFLERR